MAEAASRLQRLIDALDLGTYEIAIYLAVVEHGELTASEVDEKTDVPQPRVYDTARSLRDRGLVEVDESRPFRITAIDPELAFDEIRSTLDTTVATLKENYTAPPEKDRGATIIESRANIMRHVGDTIAAAENELALMLSPELLDRFEEAIEAARDRGVLIDLSLAPARQARSHDGFPHEDLANAVHTRAGVANPVVACADGFRTVYTSPDAIHEGEDEFGVVFTRSQLANLTLAIYYTLWYDSTPEYEAAPPTADDFPRTYATLYRCLRHIKDADVDLVATAHGRDVTTGEQTTVTGPVQRAEFDLFVGTVELELATDGGPVRVGGWYAATPDVEAREVTVEVAD